MVIVDLKSKCDFEMSPVPTNGEPDTGHLIISGHFTMSDITGD